MARFFCIPQIAGPYAHIFPSYLRAFTIGEAAIISPFGGAIYARTRMERVWVNITTTSRKIHPQCVSWLTVFQYLFPPGSFETWAIPPLRFGRRKLLAAGLSGRFLRAYGARLSPTNDSPDYPGAGKAFKRSTGPSGWSAREHLIACSAHPESRP